MLRLVLLKRSVITLSTAFESEILSWEFLKYLPFRVVNLLGFCFPFCTIIEQTFTWMFPKGKAAELLTYSSRLMKITFSFRRNYWIGWKSRGTSEGEKYRDSKDQTRGNFRISDFKSYLCSRVINKWDCFLPCLVPVYGECQTAIESSTSHLATYQERDFVQTISLNVRDSRRAQLRAFP